MEHAIDFVAGAAAGIFFAAPKADKKLHLGWGLFGLLLALIAAHRLWA